MDSCRRHMRCVPETEVGRKFERMEIASLWSLREELPRSKDQLVEDVSDMTHAGRPESLSLAENQAPSGGCKLRALGKHEPLAHAEGSPQINKPEELGGGKPSILLVDDNCDTLWTFGRELLRCGYNVVTCVSGRDAMAMLDSCAFELMITGLKSTRVDGLTLIDYARQLGQPIKAIVTTEFGSRPLRNLRCEKAVTYLEKPVHPEDLVDTIIELLSMDEGRLPHGTIAELHWLEALQLMMMCRRKSVLAVSATDGERYSFFVHNGQIQHVQGAGGVEGEEAFFKCLDSPARSFQEKTWTDPPHVTIQKKSLALLKEGASRLDKLIPHATAATKS
jgi:CheY-like chemotaxis protein